MAAFAYTDATLSVNAVDLSDHVVSLGFSVNGQPLEVTAMGDSWKDFIGGLKSWQLSAELHQDFAASKTFFTLQGVEGTTTAIVVKPTSAAVSTTNPSFSGNVFVSDVPYLSGSVGDLSTISVTWDGAGALTVATS